MSFISTIQRIGTGIVTGGTSELIRLIAPGIAEKAEQLYFPATLKQLGATASLVALPLGISSATVAAQKTGATWDASHGVFVNPAHGLVATPTPQPVYGGQPMGFNLGGLLGGLGNVFGQSDSGLLQGVGQIAGAFGTAYSQPTVNYPIAVNPQPVGVAMPVSNSVARMGRTSLSAMTNEIITAGGKLLGTLGINVSSAGAFSSILKRSIGAIASLARRTPGGTLISMLVGIGLTAYEANLLSAWHAQRKRGRRMNPANSKALRRAARRIKSFHKLCTHTDVLRTRSRGFSRSRCGTCKKSPCRC